MARTPLASRIEAIVARDATRRQFLGAAGAATVAAAAWSPRAWGADGPRVVIVGGGLAGLTAAYRLKQAGIVAQLYDANDRFGGRCWSMDFGNGQVVERGGELIDSGHLDIKHLVQELRLDLDNLLQAEPNGTEPLSYFEGVPYTETEVEADLNGIYQKLHKDTTAASFPTTYTISTDAGRILDRTTLYQWIEDTVPNGHASRLGQLLDVAYNIEFGAETTDQSALNLIYLLGYIGQGQFNTFGKSNEKFHVRGGNEQIAKRMVAALDPAQLHLKSAMSAIARNTDGTYTLTVGGKKVVADRVVLALPFSILRTLDYAGAGFRNVKKWAIDELGMGTNSKLHVGFKTRHWYTWDCNGETYSDTGYQNTWEVSRAQPGPSGVLVDYTGGIIGDSFGSGSASTRAQQFLDQIEPVLPGISAQWDRRAAVQYWHAVPWTKGSYSYYKPGQYQRFGGAEAEIEGGVHFAGEHTTQDFQGYLNGAVYSGNRVAAEVKSALGR